MEAKGNRSIKEKKKANHPKNGYYSNVIRKGRKKVTKKEKRVEGDYEIE